MRILDAGHAVTESPAPPPEPAGAGTDDSGMPVDLPGADRNRAAQQRDQLADARDAAADERDQAADERDTTALDTIAQVAKDQPDLARVAADAIGASGGDRVAAAQERDCSADDRIHAAADRTVDAEERLLLSFDALTGTYRRDTGLVELERQLVRAHRTGQSYFLCFLDIDGLKVTNDVTGHAAGDHLLQQVADAIRANLRSSDLVVRLGGDEFACGLLDLTREQATTRLLSIQRDLREQSATVTIGLAELRPEDTLHSLLSRADEDMYRQRRAQRPSRTR